MLTITPKVINGHAMLTGKYPRTGLDPQTHIVNMEVTMFWDGLFHVFTWIATAVGLALLWRATGRPDVSGPCCLGRVAGNRRSDDEYQLPSSNDGMT